MFLETVSVKTHDISDRCNAYNLKLNAEEMQEFKSDLFDTIDRQSC